MNNLVKFLEDRGPVTGKELVAGTAADTFSAWRECNNTMVIVTRIIGRRYLRLDRKVAGYARLSPSIMREFLNYTIIGLDDQNNAISTIADQLEKTIAEISTRKIELARETIARLLEQHPDRKIIYDRACFIIAGDVVFNMAHAEPRPEVSTGELVRGSDLDIIVVDAGLPEELRQNLDNIIYQEKHNLLMNPALKEEIDYIIKSMAAVEEQLKFGDFKAMVASKILNEGLFLSGNYNLYNQIRQLLIRHDIPEKIQLLEVTARQSRIDAEERLILADEKDKLNELMSLFYTTEEKEEIF